MPESKSASTDFSIKRLAGNGMTRASFGLIPRPIVSKLSGFFKNAPLAGNFNLACWSLNLTRLELITVQARCGSLLAGAEELGLQFFSRLPFSDEEVPIGAVIEIVFRILARRNLGSHANLREVSTVNSSSKQAQARTYNCNFCLFRIHWSVAECLREIYRWSVRI